MKKRTKIICTVGPSTDKPGILDKMIAAGMNVARFNFSHGTHEDHAKRIALVRAAAKRAGIPIALMLDTKGPEMRIGKFSSGKEFLSEGQTFTLTNKEIPGTKNCVSISYKNLSQEVMPGNMILMADGLISLKVEKIADGDIITTVQNSGEISNNKRLAVPWVRVNLPPISEQDELDIRFGIGQDMDFIAASFIQQAADVLAIRKLLEDANSQMKIIAKIENQSGVDNINKIIEVADGVMVARGDLGVEIPAEDVPLIQKKLINLCNQTGKPVITATQMLESMMSNPRPTRAEASDIANAIMDGTDAIMLSGETASGLYPVEAVGTMAKIAVRTEQDLQYGNILTQKGIQLMCTTTDAISHATAQIAHELGASAIITATESGNTARMVSKYRPKALIGAVTPCEKTVRQMQLLWGVYPVLSSQFNNSDEMVGNSIQAAEEAKLVTSGDLVVVTAGLPPGISGTTNMIRVHVVANVLVKGQGIGQRNATGRVCIVKSHEDLSKFSPGDILVIAGIDELMVSKAIKASAIIAETGGLTSDAAIIGVNYNLPVVVNASGALDCLKDGMLVTVDASRGLVYQGEANAR